jgi:aspartyl-tRNA(Asn)/glutamyl-tRNA(Gln) amidotransferase subunit C
MVSEPRITRAEVEHVARLARLALDEEEVVALTRDLAQILEHAAQVSALDTSGVEPTAHPVGLVNVLRPDEARPGLDPEPVLVEAPDREGDRFRVPRILGEDR